MSNSRRTVRPVRQLSLQQTTSRRQHIRRQRSAEDDKSLQIYANPITRGRLAVSGAEKPKVRVAWGDDRHGGDNDLERVEVVARQIPSRSKQTTSGRSGGKNYVVGGEKASILYSRQELAERLRLAWKHREENKSNIDIFLAHGFTVEEQCDSELSISAPATPLPKNEPAFGREKVTANWRGDSAKLNSSQEKFINVFGESKDSGLENGSGEVGETNDNEKSKTASSDTTKSDLAMRNSEEEGTTESTKKKDKENVTDLNVEEKRRTRINIDCTNLHPQHRSTASFPSLKAEIPAISTKVNGNDDFSAARQKRASFHSGTNRAFLVPMTEKPAKVPAEANKCLATDKLVSAKSIETTRCTSASSNRIVRQATTDVKSSTVFDRSIVLTRSSSTISPEKARRTNSAPPQRRTQGGEDGGGNSIFAQRVQVNIVIDTPGLAEVTNNKSIACGQQDGKNAVERQEEGLAKISRPVRSAFLKKRSRSAKRRFLASSGAAGKDEAQDRCGGRARAYMDPRTTDVVTMVSLVSSVDSDSDTENSPRDDKLINELRSKLPTTPIIKTSINPNPSVTRKPIKSVSFQRYSFDEDSARETHLQTSTRTKDEKLIIGVQPARFNCVVNGHGENESSWRQQQNPAEEIATPLTVSTLLIQDLTETTPETALLTDREKRCLAVPIGDLHDDKKRKLLRTRSISSRPSIPEQTSNNASVEVKEQRPPHLVEGSTSPINGRTPLPKTEQYVKEMLPVKEIPPREVTLSTEPRFQTTKEKECWHLYRRMCDKGVCVSFDTVLRGMLTPTEYRLRQKELSQDL